MTPSCKGCRHLVTFGMYPGKESVCKALETWEYREFESPDGKVVRRMESTGGDWIRETISKRRAPDGKCGPEARLREPGIWERLIKLLRRNAP